MKIQKQIGQSLSLVVSLALIASCQPGLDFPAKTNAPAPAEQLELPQSGFVCEPLKIALSRVPQLSLKATGTEAVVTLPECGSTGYVRLAVTGVGIDAPIYAQGADESGLLAVDAVCSTTFLLPEIPNGNGRILIFEAFDSEMQPLEDLTYRVVFNLNDDEIEIALNCLTTAVAKVYQATRQYSEAVATHLDLDALHDFVGAILGVGEEPYLFEVDPSFLNISALAADLISVDGDISQLSSQSEAYLENVGIIHGQFGGLVLEDKLELHLNNPAASELTDLGNGSWLIDDIEPGDWLLTLSADSSNGTSYQLPDPIPVHVEAQGQLDLGLITVTPATPTITGVSENPVQVAEVLEIQGSGFHANVGGNTVTLDGEPLEIVSASPTALGVLIPREPGPGHEIQVEVGTEISNTFLLEISRLRWEIDTDNMLFTTPAIGPDGTLYIATENGRIQAIEPESGAVIWTYDGLTPCYNSPVLTASGRVYVVSKSGQVIALNASDGSLIYLNNLNSLSFSSPAVDHNDNIYFVTEANEVISLNATGAERWRFQGDAVSAPNPFSISPSPVLGENEAVLFSGSLDGNVYALNSNTGVKIWERPTGSAIYASPALSQDGKLYIMTFAGLMMRLNTSDGAQDWSYDIHSYSTSAPTLDDSGHLYFGSWSGKIYKMTVEGALLGSKNVASSVEVAPLLDQDGRVYFGTTAGRVFVFDSELLGVEWQFKLPNDVSASVAMDQNGLLYITSQDPGKIYSLYSDAGSLMGSDWPKYRGNLGNTGSLGFN